MLPKGFLSATDFASIILSDDKTAKEVMAEIALQRSLDTTYKPNPHMEALERYGMETLNTINLSVEGLEHFDERFKGLIFPEVQGLLGSDGIVKVFEPSLESHHLAFSEGKSDYHTMAVNFDLWALERDFAEVISYFGDQMIFKRMNRNENLIGSFEELSESILESIAEIQTTYVHMTQKELSDLQESTSINPSIRRSR